MAYESAAFLGPIREVVSRWAMIFIIKPVLDIVPPNNKVAISFDLDTSDSNMMISIDAISLLKGVFLRRAHFADVAERIVPAVSGNKGEERGRWS